MHHQKIRDSFHRFFKEKGHEIIKSSSVVPQGNPDLLFTNAGMNPFKDIFLGTQTPTYKRVVNIQKCLRVSGKHNDLEDVGQDTYHHTFFEMMGNWSFGDYGKKEAIEWAWELLTDPNNGWALPKKKLYATVYEDDQESYDLWKKYTDIDPSHLLFFGKKDNFWEMGNTGPCGPCTEIHMDLGEHIDSSKNAWINSGSPRYVELWNIVFIQYYRNRTRSAGLAP